MEQLRRRVFNIRCARAAVMAAAFVLFGAAYCRDYTGISLEWLSFGGVCLLLMWFYLGSKLPKKRS
ncbi:MAG: hypothetical protein Q4D82_03755 [Neisseria sp.]|nr:hypothetical protein [Neisseria sp.]